MTLELDDGTEGAFALGRLRHAASLAQPAAGAVPDGLVSLGSKRG